ncbi:MAG: DegT/DnrJ/EryC1/StrS family aminotransferase [Candidatus Aminicenantaceae bacterium]
MGKKFIPHSSPFIDRSALERVDSTIESGQLAQGPKVAKFEDMFQKYIGVKYAAASSSGTSALHLALRVLEIGEKDEVIIPSYVCTAVLNAVNYTGATPVIVDIDPLTYNISIDEVKRAITKKTKAIIVPHMFGCVAEVDRLMKINIPVIEDCAQAAGAVYKGRKAGSFGLMSVFSFYATKVLTCGEGGMVLSNSKALISKIKDIRDYDNKKKYILRYNYKMTDIQASLGMDQLSKLDKFIDRRIEIARHYFKEFKDCDFSLPLRRDNKSHIYYRFVIETKRKATEYLKKLRVRKIRFLPPVYKPLHVYLNIPGFPNTDIAWEKAISIPLYPSLTQHEIERIVVAVKEIFKCS